nr:mediator of RNA polymerase II transcription subunit 22A-like [Tanacetum cinerariifolium]
MHAPYPATIFHHQPSGLIILDLLRGSKWDGLSGMIHTMKKILGTLSFTMNKSGAGGGTSRASGPTAAAVATSAQKKILLQQKVNNDIGSIIDHFSNIVSVARVNDPPVRNSQEAFMMEVQAARMVQAADSLLKLVSKLRQTAIFSGFASLNDHVDENGRAEPAGRED